MAGHRWHEELRLQLGHSDSSSKILRKSRKGLEYHTSRRVWVFKFPSLKSVSHSHGLTLPSGAIAPRTCPGWHCFNSLLPAEQAACGLLFIRCKYCSSVRICTRGDSSRLVLGINTPELTM